MVTNRAVIGKSPVSGNGLFANADILPGEAIFESLRPLITALDAKQVHQTCGNCFFWTAYSKTGDRGVSWRVENNTVRACSACKSVYFCSKSCQTECWKRIHKYECKLLTKVQEGGILPNVSRAALHMLWMSPSHEKSPFKNLKSHLQDMQNLAGERWERMLALSSALYRWSGTKMPVQYVQHCFATILTNSLTLYTPTYDQLGIAVDPFASTANHSCDPNAIVVFDGPKLQFRSLRGIAKDEEIFISYVDTTNPVFVRKVELRERFHFHCHCSKCSQGPVLKEDLFSQSADQLSPQWKDEVVGHLASYPDIARKIRITPDITHIASIAEDHSRKLLAETQSSESTLAMDAETALAKLNEALQTLTATSIWPEYRQPIPMIRHGLFMHLLGAKRYAEALYQLMLVSEIYETLYPIEWHPVRNVHAWTVAMLAIFLFDEKDNLKQSQILSTLIKNPAQLTSVPQAIKQLLDHVKDCAAKSHGSASSFYMLAERKVEEAKTGYNSVSSATETNRLLIEAQQSDSTRGWSLLKRLILHANNAEPTLDESKPGP